MIEIRLKNQETFPWINFNDCIYIRGYFYDKNNKVLNENLLFKKLSHISCQSDLVKLLKTIDGCFSIIILNKNKNTAIIASDRIRSFPIFYFIYDSKIFICDHIKKNDTNFDKNSLSYFEFLHCGYVSGSDTLIDKIYQIQAGECISFDEKGISSKKYYSYINKNEKLNDLDYYKKKLQNALEKTFSKLIESTKDRFLIIPLSGGLDSRLIASYLKKCGVDDVICYTYGLRNSKEVKISKNIANDLGYDWHFINYGDKKWRKWYTDPRMKEYQLFSGNFSSLPHIQDWPAVLELNEKKIIPDNSVFIPGHAADFVAGSHIPKKINLTLNPNFESVIDLIINEHLILSDKISQKRNTKFRLDIYRKLSKQINETSVKDLNGLASSFEYWDWRERQSKFIANSCRVYEFWGYEWRMPFWDIEFINFWNDLPLELRLEKLFYKEFLLKEDFSEVFSSYNYKNFDKKNFIYFFKKSFFGKVLSKIHKQFYAYYKFRYIDFISKKDILKAYNINSILVMHYLELIKMSND
tara:strand:+ start:94 stop:1668 length:1575 start_codon:yes stop_codon:yes gene_type:complete